VDILFLQFEDAFSMPDPKEALQELIDPSLGGDYPIDSVLKVRDAVKPTPHSFLFSTLQSNTACRAKKNVRFPLHHQIAYLAKSCTHEDPSLRPTMRSVVVALMALSSKE
jgi:chitin elicitor receptor kinase 1